MAQCKEPACQCRRNQRPMFSPWVGRSPGEGNGNPLQYSCLGNSMDREAWWATVQGVTKSRTRLSAHRNLRNVLLTDLVTDNFKQRSLVNLLGNLTPLSWDDDKHMLNRFSLFLTLCNLMDCSRPGSSVHEILQARITELVAMPSSRGSFLTQGSNPYLSCIGRWVLYLQCHLGSPMTNFIAVQWPSCVWLFATPWTAACQSSISHAISQSLPKFMSIASVMPSSHLISDALFCPQSFPVSGTFLTSRLFTLGDQNTEASASASSLQWIFRVDFPWDWMVWSHCSPRDSQESSPTPQFKSINSSVLSFLYSPTLISIHDYWKNRSLD